MHSEYRQKCFPKCLFNHMWSHCDLDLWPFDLEIYPVHLWPQLHQSRKWGEIATSGL